MNWENFLNDREHHNLYVSALVYMPTIKIIRRIASADDLILEAGCGSGRTAILLADMGYKVVAFDRLLALLERISPVTSFLDNIQLIAGDIGFLPFKKKTFKISYSCGVLEHFDKPDIISFLREQRQISTYVLVDVPNDRCDKQCFGDERFYTDETWRAMFKDAGLSVKKFIHRGMDNGKYVGNCSVILATDMNDNQSVPENIDVYDHY